MARRRDDKADMLGASIHSPSPLPPFQAMVSWLVYITFRLDSDAVRQFVPPQLVLGTGNAMLAFYESSISWGLGPHGRCVLGVEVEGHDSPDTNKAMFMTGNIISGDAFAIMSAVYGRADAGRVRVLHNEESISATVFGPGNEVWIDASLRVTGPIMPNNSGIDRYIGESDTGLVQHDVAYSGTAKECEIERLDFMPSAPPALRACEPISVHFAGVNPEFAGASSVPWALTIGVDNPTLGSYLDLTEVEGRAAAVFSSKGELLRGNDKAAQLLQQIAPSTLSGALTVARQTNRPVHLSRMLGPPVLARSVSFRLPGTIDTLHLVLLIDLAAPQTRPSAPFLRLLGLTEAESQIAEMVGSGLTARDAARALGLTENTVRSTLKLIYGKLGISKQSELGGLVARLQF